MNTRKTLPAVVLTAALAVGTLSACSSDEDGVTLEVLTGMSTGSVQLEALTEVTENFEAAHEGITVTLVAGSTSYEADLKVRLAAQNAPDLWNTHGWSRDRYAEFLLPLQDEEWASRLNPVLDTAIRDETDAFYALPLDVAVTGIIYNQDLLDEVGVDAASIETWEDFDAACELIVATGAACIGASGKDNWTAGNIADYISSGLYTDDELAELTAGTFDTSIYETGMQLVSDWAEKDYFNIDYTASTDDDTARGMASNQIAFVFQPNGFVQSVETYNPDINVGFMPYPALVGDSYLVTGEDYAFGASASGEHTAEALAYLEFLAQPEQMQILSDTTNNAPGLIDVELNLGQLATSFTTWVEEEDTRTVAIFDRVYLPNGMWNTMVTTTDAVITGQGTAAEGAAQMKTSFDSLFGQAS